MFSDNRNKRSSTLACLALMLSLLPGECEGAVSFEKDVRPILKAHCFDCHGEGETLKGDLDLRLRRLMVKGGESGPAIVPGQPDESRLLQLIRKGEMPKRDKKLSAAEVEVIGQWIAGGAKNLRPEPESPPSGMIITEEERSHWAFQPVKRPRVPRIDAGRNAVDSLLGAAMQKHGLSFSPEAARLTQLRRLYIGLLGVPPSPEESDEFISDTRPNAYERLVERLLASPQYGERWARHWLDIAGYADSDGSTEADTLRPWAFKYRDYVIRAFNSDKPFDRFVLEQLAGDELAGPPPYTNLSAEGIELLTATGFLRNAPDGTAAKDVDGDVTRNQVIADTIQIVTTSLLGLSVACAQCHDHRYDPIPQRDYYALRAVFEPAYDPKRWRTPPERLISLHREADRIKAAELEAEAAKLNAEKETKTREFISAALEKHLQKKYPSNTHVALREAFHTPADKRTAAQKKVLDDNPSVNITPFLLDMYDRKASDELKAIDAKIGKVRAAKPPEDNIQALTEIPGHIPVTHLFHRGDPKQPKDQIGPGALTVLSQSGERARFQCQVEKSGTSGRRLAFARWLVSPENPLLPRVIVNRIWMHHFGRGLVGTPADFGLMGEKPTHPELLDWLASEFMESGWSVKHIQRLIVLSRVYRQSSARTGAENIDEENRFYWRMEVRRLDAEALRDTLIEVSSGLTRRMYGPVVPVRDDIFGQIVVGIDKKEGDTKTPVEVPLGAEEFRRSIYVMARRSQPLALLSAFDGPPMEINCEKRQSSTVAPQALMLMNSDFILKQATRFAERLARATQDANERVTLAFRLAFSRAPTAREMQNAQRFLQTQAEYITAHPLPIPAKSGTKPIPEPTQQALVNFCQSLLGASEFLYID